MCKKPATEIIIATIAVNSGRQATLERNSAQQAVLCKTFHLVKQLQPRGFCLCVGGVWRSG